MTSAGTVLNDRYRLVRRLGKGSMGSVWEANDATLERTVAVKELLSDPSTGESMSVRLERVRREALALAAVEHPAIVTIHDLIYVRSPEDQARGNPWIVMGYAHGRSLDAIIAADAPLTERRVASIGLAVLEGLLACHKRSFYHRDVKPANIVVGEGGSVRLVDFGIVRMAGKESLTAPSYVLGTPQFLAPEMLEAHPAVGPSTDLWALAVTLYSALTGESPFRADTLGATYAAITSKTPPRPGDGPLADLVLRMLRKRPRDRPEVTAVQEVLRDVADGQRGTAGLGGRGGGSSLPGHDLTAERGDDPRYGPRSQPSNHRRGTRQFPSGPRPTPLHGMPVPTAAQRVANLATGQAVAELLALDEAGAASIINRCDDLDGGRLLSAIATRDAVRARKILDMVTTDRAGQFLDQMSPVAAAAALSRPPAAGAAGILGGADTPTVVEALTEMSPGSAASVVLEMHGGRAVEVLDRTAVRTAANILLRVPAARRQVLLDRLSPAFRAAVIRHL